MRITYVNHACLFIELGGRKIVTDPWFDGPAYANQWHPFPKPVNAELVDQADTILISHAHEDHLHEPTLRRLNPAKRVYYPFNWYDGTPDWLRSMGFAEVTEAVSCRTYDLGPGAKVTFIVNSHDSIMVLEDGREVVVNVNDALHSSEPLGIDAFTSYIKQRWPRIDTVFCGFGGASYFPNTLHGPGKDDRAVAMLREQLFAQNFCRIIDRLSPLRAVPFAADFALLGTEQRWINEARFPREELPRYFRQQGGKADILVMYSGDRIDDGRFEASALLRDRLAAGNHDALLSEQYPVQVSAFAVARTVERAQLDQLAARLQANVEEHAAFYDASRVRDLEFSVSLRDAVETTWLNVTLRDGRAQVARAEQPSERAVAQIVTTADVLGRCLDSEWGGDAIIIGYACDVYVTKHEDLINGRGRLCAELCVRHPRPRAYAMKHPLRVARFLAQTPFALGAQLKGKLRAMTGSGGRSVVNGSHWLAGDPAEIRRACGLPDYAFGDATR